MHRTNQDFCARFADERASFTEEIFTIFGQRLLKARATLSHACIARPAWRARVDFDVRSPLSIIRRFERTRAKRGTRRRVARRAQAARPRRLCGAACRPPAERISAGKRRTAGLADGVYPARRGPPRAPLPRG